MEYNSTVCEFCPLRQSPEMTNGVGNKVLYYLFLTVFIGGIIFGLINIVIVGRSIRNSRDSYFLALTLPCTLVLLFGGVLRLSEYTEVTNVYIETFGYMCCIHNWLFYTTLWILLVAAVGRTLHVSGAGQMIILTPTHAFIISVTVYCLCFISVLPQFWYCPTHETKTTAFNNTFPNQSTKPESQNQNIYLWVTLAVTIFVPFPVYSVCIFFLAKVVRLKRNSRRRHSLQHGTGQILNRQATSQMRVNRLFISMIASMLLLCGPKLILKFLINMSEKDRLGPGIVSEILEFLFYLYFAIPFFLFCKHSQNFRSTLVHTFCSCLKHKCQRHVEKRYSVHEL